MFRKAPGTRGGGRRWSLSSVLAERTRLYICYQHRDDDIRHERLFDDRNVRGIEIVNGDRLFEKRN